MSAKRVILVTGGSLGIGKEIAGAFHKNGDEVIICARDSQALSETARELGGAGNPLATYSCDVSEPNEVEEMIADLSRRFNRIDVLVNNAGIYGPIGFTHENSHEEWLKALKINLFGVFLMTKYVVPVMIQNGNGVIINLSGGGATSPKPRYSAYAAAKTGVVRLTENLAHELAEFNIRVNAIAPGFIKTRFHQETISAGKESDPDVEKVKEKIAKGGDDPARTAELSLFLASEKGRQVTGKLISAIWDDWSKLGETEYPDSDIFTLRRIDNVFYQEVSNG